MLSVADGNVLVANGSDFRPDDINRLGQKGQGWGKYVVIKHKDGGSTTLYAHLQEGSTNQLYEGMPVNKGDTIGKADSTGGVSGPHLHLEYAPNGRWKDKPSRVNPHPCIVCSSQEPATVTLSGPDAPTDGSQYAASGGIEPYTWSISKGSITQAGVVTVSGQCGAATVSITDICGNTQTKEVRMSSGVWIQTSQVCIGNPYCTPKSNTNVIIICGDLSALVCTSESGGNRTLYYGKQLSIGSPDYPDCGISNCGIPPAGVYNTTITQRWQCP